MYSSDHFPFAARPLPYPAKSLMPCLNARTVKIHHDWHYALHVEKLNKILEAFPKYQNLPLEALILKQAFLPEEIRADIKLHASGALSHILFFECLAPSSKSRMSDEFRTVIEENFGSTEKFFSIMKKAALSVKGSGFAYLASDSRKRLCILALRDLDNPVEHRLTPLLAIDMWEHAYYLQYQYHRAEYLNALFGIINWQRVERNYLSA